MPGLLLCVNARAAGLDTGSPIGFFTSVADKFLKAQPEFAQAGLSITNIPIYPKNCYTPAVHRLLQLAANLYDASTNKTSTAPFDLDYPSVFRPTFGVTNINGTNNVFINGFVEMGTDTSPGAPYNAPVYVLPDDLNAVVSAITSGGTNNLNIYGAPWIIGAKKGLPNFNQVSMQEFTQISRKVQIVKPNLNSPRTTWRTNVQYIVGITNTVAVEAWNSYLSNFNRAVDLGGIDTVTMTMTNENGIITNLTTSLSFGPAGAGFSISNWPGYPSDQANRILVTASMKVPLFSTVPFLPDSAYHPPGTAPGGANGSFTSVPSYTAVIPFDTTTGYPLPQFGLSVTNRLRFVMVDHATGHVIDYVQLNGMNEQRDLSAELPGDPNIPSAYGGPGGVWAPTRRSGTTNLLDPLDGITYQIFASQQDPPYNSGDSRYPADLTVSDWANAPYSAAAIHAATTSFRSFFLNQTNLNSQLSNQAPYTPTRQVSVYYTWQANDPLVHYTLDDLTGQDIYTRPQTNYIFTNIVLANVQRVNNRYDPWGGNLFTAPGDPYALNGTLKDPLVTRSDDWIFPAGPLDFSSIGRVHRGTPWQTVYLKSTPVDPALWQNWTGNTDPANAALTQPTSDWQLAGLLAPSLNSRDPRELVSINDTNLTSALSGITVVTNSDPLAYLLMDSNSPQATVIVNAVNAVRANQPGLFFHNLGDILAVPELTENSPWLDQGNLQLLGDSDFELIPSQLLPLLRPDSIGSMIQANGVLQMQFTGFDGYAYAVESSTNLQEWSPLDTLFTTNGTFIFSDPAGNGFNRRFYRSLLVPGP